MRDTVVEIVQESNGGLAMRLLRCRNGVAKVDYPNAMKFVALSLVAANMPKLDTSANVAKYGAAIRAALATHPAISDELRQHFSTGGRAALRFWITPPEGECLRWETLCELPGNFLALRNVCTISRLANLDGEGSDGRAFLDLVKMAAFLSPARISALDEYTSLTREVMGARAAGLNLECTIYLGDQELLDQALADIAAGRLSGIKAETIPHDAIAFDALLRERPVELLHFFCHGTLDPVQALELATISDTETDKESGSLRLSIERLSEILNMTGRTWVTVLNCCCGAKSAEQLHSMASILARQGSPIAVGMAEPIGSGDATIFSTAFYGSLFAILGRQLAGAAGGSSITLDLAPAVIAARRVVFGKYQIAPPDAYGRWALPLLYERGDPLTVQVIDEVMKTRINAIAGALKSLPVGTPNQVCDDILAVLDKDPKVPLSVRPDRLGIIR
jgi:hypothetical protein